MNPRESGHEVRVLGAGIPYTLSERHEDNDVPTFWPQRGEDGLGCRVRVYGLGFTGKGSRSWV